MDVQTEFSNTLVSENHLNDLGECTAEVQKLGCGEEMSLKDASSLQQQEDLIHSPAPNHVSTEDTSLAATSLDQCIDSIDRLTAIELLQLLKEYKKREFLYVSQLAHLQHELHLRKNVSQAPLITDVTSVPVPFEISPAVYHDMSAVVHNALIDPTINLEIRELRLKLYEQSVELQKTKDELKASTFSADSVMGRRLINKCKALQSENTDIGKMLLETNVKPLQIQLNILQNQLNFFKQQLKNLYSMIVDLEDDNEKLTKQLQTQTTQYKDLQKERDTLVEKIEALQQLHNKFIYVQKKVYASEKQRQELRRKSVPKDHDQKSTQRRASHGDSEKAAILSGSAHNRSESPSPSRHRHRKTTGNTSEVVSNELRVVERKESQSGKSVHRTGTSSKYTAPVREDRSRRRRATDGSYDANNEFREVRSLEKNGRSSGRSRY